MNEPRTSAELALIRDAAEAQEIFGDDELERHAEDARRRLADATANCRTEEQS